jgi:hypothetical protein
VPITTVGKKTGFDIDVVLIEVPFSLGPPFSLTTPALCAERVLIFILIRIIKAASL